MSRFIKPLVLLCALGAAVTAGAKAALIESRYGTMARFLAGTLQYPGFTVRYAEKTAQSRTDAAAPWENFVFEVLDREHKTIGGEIRFSSEERANGRRFDVRGQIYLAEFFHSTAPAIGPRGLARDAIIIWDETSARRDNPRLAVIWNQEKIDPAARYSSTNAYADGELLTGFDAATELESELAIAGAAGVRPRHVSLVTWKEASSVHPVITAAYGQRVSLRAGGIRFPDFVAQCTDTNTKNPADSLWRSTLYNFTAFSPTGANAGFAFDSSTLANGRSFELGGKRYGVEMFATTSTAAGSDAARRVTPLGPDEIIVWDEGTARACNPAIAGVWEKSAAPQALAVGTPIGPMFTGTWILGDLSAWAKRAELDADPVPQRREPARFPAALQGSGLRANLGGCLWLNADGTVDKVLVTHGNEPSLREPAAEALRHWTFTPPLRGGRSVPAFVSFRWKVAEPEVADGFELD